MTNTWELIDVVITRLTIMFSPIVAALTPSERWNAMRRLPSGSGSKGLFEIVALVVLAILVLLLVRLQSPRSRRKKQKGKGSRRSFSDLAHENGLTERERSLLLLVAERAGLKQPESVFSMSTAFDRGVEMVIQEHIDQRDDSDNVELIKGELSFLREKLDFKVRPSSLSAPVAGSRLDTRQIPVGKRLYITAAHNPGEKTIEGTVVGNTNSELKVKLTEAIDTFAGDKWAVRCPSGTSIWEFDAGVIEYGNKVLDLNHTSSIRLASRRRFPRVAVHMPAFVMRFSFAITSIDAPDHLKAGEAAGGQSPASQYDETSGTNWEPPQFVPAIVTELAGPGMRIESPIHIPMGERVLIVIGLDDDAETHSADDDPADRQKPSRMLEDIAVVRHVKRTPDGWSMAVELVGLSDTNVDELIHATNVAGTRLRAVGRKAAAETVLESVLAQGA